MNGTASQGVNKLELCSEPEALEFRQRHETYCRKLSRMTKAQLRELFETEQTAAGITSVYGGPVSKDELFSALIEMRYPISRLNMTTHVLYHHESGRYSCEWCNGPEPCGNCGASATEQCKSWCGRQEDRRQP